MTQSLSKKILEARAAYYNGNPIMPDAEYDRLETQLRNKDPENPILKTVGAPVPEKSAWTKVRHLINMGSLNKVNLPEEFDNWHKKCGSAKQLLTNEKLDGISISLKYDNGNLIQALTRGDGSIGEDITRNAKKFKGVPHKLNEDFTGHIRGEVLLFHTDWKQYVPEMANPRNAASGIAKRIDGNQSECLTVIAYTIEGKDFKTEDAALEYMKSLGFNIPNYTVGDISHAKKQWQQYMDKTRKELDYDIDGLVIRINDRAQQFTLGEENHRPKGAIAFKFEPPEAITVVNNIICQVGDTGRITPVAEFGVVDLGVDVKRASLHNFSLVTQLGINIGADIIVERANDVIPYVKQVTKKCGDPFPPPGKCPACGTKTKFIGEYLICPNKKTCPPQVIGRLNKWIKELGILEWGESILTKLIEAGKVSDVADIYTLKATDITSLDRMGEKGAKNLLDELDKYRTIALENFIGGLCIEGVATSSARAIIDAGHDTLDKILGLSVNELEAIPGFGEKKAQAFHDGLIENADRIEDIIKAGVKIKDRVKGSLTGKSFAFTGSANTPRALLQKMVEDAGGVVKKTVGAGLSYLVIADVSSTSSKAQAARKLGTTLISEDDFLVMVKRK